MRSRSPQPSLYLRPAACAHLNAIPPPCPRLHPPSDPSKAPRQQGPFKSSCLRPCPNITHRHTAPNASFMTVPTPHTLPASSISPAVLRALPCACVPAAAAPSLYIRAAAAMASRTDCKSSPSGLGAACLPPSVSLSTRRGRRRAVWPATLRAPLRGLGCARAPPLATIA